MSEIEIITDGGRRRRRPAVENPRIIEAVNYALILNQLPKPGPGRMCLKGRSFANTGLLNIFKSLPMRYNMEHVLIAPSTEC
ncbi:hypothetical protein [Leisingera sp. HS039]|uniref:hypothetical protein n=1 Tax=Leisingera sp. HS039 TaxID=2818496 RepID=UPI001B39FAAD|nr:hypothetical protein [Leisingera sp. HS039]